MVDKLSGKIPLTLQEVKMQEVAMPHSEEMALSLYQFATLQYTRGLLSHAEELCLDSLDLARKFHKKDSSSHVSPSEGDY